MPKLRWMSGAHPLHVRCAAEAHNAASLAELQAQAQAGEGLPAS